MARTFVKQPDQIKKSDIYDDTIAPSQANYELAPVSIEDDLNAIRSALHTVATNRGGNWYDDLNTPTSLDPGSKRGVNDLNQDLHALERKRLLVQNHSTADVVVTAGQNFQILGAGELPGNLIAAVGAVTTKGTVGVSVAGQFGQHLLDEVVGILPVKPKNLVMVVEGDSRDVIYSGDRIVHGLLQFENAADGHTITSTAGSRAQISFVRINLAGDDLEAVPVADIENKKVNLSFNERKAIGDLNEQDFLSGSIVDLQSAAVVTRQEAYDNQGATPVDLTTNATLDLEGPGLEFKVRDDLEADLFKIAEGSAGGNSSVSVEAAADSFSVAATTNNFTNYVDSNGVLIGGSVNTLSSPSANDLVIDGGQELKFDDANRVGSTWASEIKLSSSTAEWDAYETQFGGEASIMSAVTAAAQSGGRTAKVYADVTANVAADTDIGGAGGGTNLSVQLPDLSTGTFEDNHDLYLNGELMRPASSSSSGSGGGEGGGGEATIDAEFSNVSLLLPLDSDFTDVSSYGRSATVSGDTTISTVTHYKYGTSSSRITDTRYLVVPNYSGIQFGSGDFTMEAWVKQTSAGSINLFGIGGANTGSYAAAITDQGALYQAIYGQPAGTESSATGLVSLNTWHHVAFVRSSGTLLMFLDGTQVYSTAYAASITSADLNVGGLMWGSATQTGEAFIDEVRITKGVARYTANFTPPTEAFPTTGPALTDPYFYNTSLLLNMDSGFGDSSVHQHAATSGANASISNSEFKYGGGSGYFNGNGDNVSFASSDSLDLRGVDWTMETWIRPSGDYSNWRMILTKRSASGDYNYQLYLNQNSGEIRFYGGGEPGDITTGVTPTANVWSHLAVVRNNGTVTIYLNGTSIGSGTADTDFNSQPLGIGCVANGVNGFGGHGFSGHMDDVRITKGVARYTSNFTPPTEAHLTTGPVEIVSTNMVLELDAEDYGTVGYNGGTKTSAGNDPIYVGTGEKYFQFNGAGHISWSSSSDYSPGTGDFTVESWTKGSMERLIQGDNTIDGSGNDIWWVGSSPTYGMMFNLHGPGTRGFRGGAGHDFDSWTHTVMVRKQGDNAVYINGQKQTLSLNNIDGQSVGQSGVIVGAGTANAFTTGQVGAVRLFRRALTEAEVLQNYNVTKDRFNVFVTDGLQLHLDAGDTNSYSGSGTTWFDLSGNSLNGNIVGPTYSSQDGGLFSFDGSNDYINLGAQITYSELTIKTVVMAESSQTAYANIFDNKHTATTNFVVQQEASTTNSYRFIVPSKGDSGVFQLTPNQWYDLTFTVSSQEVKVYINGSLSLTGALSSPLVASNPNLLLGQLNAGGRNWNGKMGEFSIYNRVLSGGEVLQNFEATKSRFGL